MKKIFLKALTALLTIAVLVTPACGILSLEVFAVSSSEYGDYGGTIYYVDNVSGSDSNDGTSPSSAWKSLDKVNATVFVAGDQILFKSGGVWNGRVIPQGSGEEGKPIIIGKYGGDVRPIINGASAFYDGFFEGSTILIYNEEYYEIHDLAITNKPDVTMASCFGIWIVAEDFGVADYYVVNNCHFSNITQNTRSNINNAVKYGSVVDNFVRANGISGSAVKFSALVGSEKIPTRFNGVYVTNNEVANIEQTAISLGSDWGDHQVSGWVVDQEEQVNSTNIRIANNVIYGTGAAVTLFYVDGSKGDGCIVENNVCWNTDNGNSFWVMWSASTIDLIYRGNEIFGMDQNSGSDDGIFDADGQSVGTVFEYNYTHHNAGPVYIPCSIEWDDADFADPYVRSCVWRYNISFNDNWRGLRGKGTFFNNGSENIYFYNNLIATDSYDVKLFDINIRNAYIYNNIFYNLETYRKGSNVSCIWNSNGDYKAHVKNNCFYNVDEYISFVKKEPLTQTVYTSYKDFNDAGIIAKDNFTSDPKLNMPSLPTIDSENGKQTAITGDNCYNAYLDSSATGDHHGIANVIANGCFTLQADSPCIGAGILVPTNGGMDFFGNPVSETQAPDVGVHQYTQVASVKDSKAITNLTAKNIKEHSFDLTWNVESNGAAVYRYVVYVDGKPYTNIQSTHRRTKDNTFWGPCKGTAEIFNDKIIPVEDLDYGTEYDVFLRAYYGIGENDFIESATIKVSTKDLEASKRTLTVKDMKVYYYDGDNLTLTEKDTFNSNDPIHIEALIVDGNGTPVRGATVRLLIEAVGLESVVYDVGVTGSDGIARLGTRSQYLPNSKFNYKLSVWTVEKDGYTFAGERSKSVTAKGFGSKYNLNLLSNSDFKDLDSKGMPSDWRIINSSAVTMLKGEGPNGETVADIRASSNISTTIRQDLSKVPNGTYTLTAWVRNNNTSSKLSVYRTGNSTEIAIPINEEWTQIIIPEVKISTGDITVDVTATLYGDYSQYTQICNIELSRNMLYNTDISSLHPAKGLTLPANFYYKSNASTVNVGDTDLTDAENDENLKAVGIWYYTGENYRNALYINSDKAFNFTMGQYKDNLTSGYYTFSASTLATGGVNGVMRIRDAKTGATYEKVINSSARYQTTKVTAKITGGAAYVEFLFSGDGDISKYISVLEMSFSNRSDVPSETVMTVLPGQNLMETLNGDFEHDGKVTNYIATGWDINKYKGYFDAYVVDEDKHSGDYSLKCTLDEKAYHNLAGTQFTQGGVTPKMSFTNLPAGTYTFRVWIRANLKFKIGVKTQKQTISYIPWYNFEDDEWHELVIDDIEVIDGTMQINTWFDRNAQSDNKKLNEDLMLYAYLDDFSITLNESDYIENGDAENVLAGSPTSWNVKQTKGYASLIASKEAYQGEYSAMAVLPGTDSELTVSYDDISVTEGNYALSTYIRGNGKVKFSIKTDTASQPIIAEFDATEDWKEVIIKDIAIDSLTEKIEFTVTNLTGNTSSFVSFDNMKLATVIDSSAIAKTLPSVEAVKLGENLTLPKALLDGYAVSIHSTSNQDIIALDGTVNIPDKNTFLTVTFKVVNEKDASDVAYASRVVTVYGYE